MPHSEQKTRQRIDEQLRAADWQADTLNLLYSNGVRPEHGKNMAIAEVPFGDGYADYALFVGLRLIGIVEAKKSTKDVMADVSYRFDCKIHTFNSPKQGSILPR